MGDSTAYGLDLFFPHDRLPDTQIGGTYELGCGFSELPYRFREQVTDVTKCQQWEQRTREYVLQQQPATTVIQSHAWVAFDRTRDGID